MPNFSKNNVIVAPMVRVSTLPFRLLCLDYGADLVYTEETIDFKMLRSVKSINEALETIDFVDEADGTIFFRTCNREKNHLIFQIGTCDPERALKVAKLVEDHVAGVDINMGCPKEFSLKGGMGAALLRQPEKVKEILSTLTKNLNVPVTCKIRILPTLEETVSLCQQIESCGVAAIAVHGRTKEERPNHANHNDIIRGIAESLTIPVIANGGSKEIENFDGIENFRHETGASSVMIARAAMWNCSILRKEGKLPIDTIIKEFLKYCIQYDNPFTFTKYTVQNILRELQCTEKGKAFLETQTLQEISALWDLKEFFNNCTMYHSNSFTKFHFNTRAAAVQSIEDVSMVETEVDGVPLIEMPLQFIRGNYGIAELPKVVLTNYVFKRRMKRPAFTSEMVEKSFTSVVEVDNRKYRSSVKEKSRKFAEQGAALVCLHALGEVAKTYGFVPSEDTRKYANFTSAVSDMNNSRKRERDENATKKSKNRKFQKEKTRIFLDLARK